MAGEIEPHVGHGAMEVADSAPNELVAYNPDAPSEEWGWHGHWGDFAKTGKRALIGLGIAGLLLMLLGNHVSHVEDYFLVLTALILGFWLLRSEAARKRRERTKI